MQNNFENYRNAVDINDKAHRKTLQQRVVEEETPVDRILEEVGREASMWLDHLAFIHEQGKYRTH